MSKLMVSGYKFESVDIGKQFQLNSESPIGRYEVVFEDDGSTGYFYPMDHEKNGNPIITAFGIYDSDSLAERNVKITVIWGEDATKVALLMNGVAQAYFDFSEYKGTCKTEFCPIKNDIEFYSWNEEFMGYFFG
jgi:hypothetical protein